MVNLFIEAFIMVEGLLGLVLLWRGYQLLDAQIDWEQAPISWNWWHGRVIKKLQLWSELLLSSVVAGCAGGFCSIKAILARASRRVVMQTTVVNR
jgi:hypothetical protein